MTPRLILFINRFEKFREEYFCSAETEHGTILYHIRNHFEHSKAQFPIEVLTSHNTSHAQLVSVLSNSRVSEKTTSENEHQISIKKKFVNLLINDI